MTKGGVRYKATSPGLKGAGRPTIGICVKCETDQTEADEEEAEVGTSVPLPSPSSFGLYRPCIRANPRCISISYTVVFLVPDRG